MAKAQSMSEKKNNGKMNAAATERPGIKPVYTAADLARAGGEPEILTAIDELAGPAVS